VSIYAVLKAQEGLGSTYFGNLIQKHNGLNFELGVLPCKMMSARGKRLGEWEAEVELKPQSLAREQGLDTNAGVPHVPPSGQ